MLEGNITFMLGTSVAADIEWLLLRAAIFMDNPFNLAKALQYTVQGSLIVIFTHLPNNTITP